MEGAEEDMEEEEEEWEAVSVEKEQWVQLCVKLELLTQLSLLSGVDQLRNSPHILYVSREQSPMDEEEEEEKSILDLSRTKLSMLIEGMCTNRYALVGGAPEAYTVVILCVSVCMYV